MLTLWVTLFFLYNTFDFYGGREGIRLNVILNQKSMDIHSNSVKQRVILFNNSQKVFKICSANTRMRIANLSTVISCKN